MGDAAALTSVVLTVLLTVTETLNPGVDGTGGKGTPAGYGGDLPDRK